MKKIFLIICVLFIPFRSYGEELAVSCISPSGGDVIQVEIPNIVFSTGGSCESNFANVTSDFTNSCLLSTVDELCLMYAPANTQYKDTIGTYLYTENCPLE